MGNLPKNGSEEGRGEHSMQSTWPSDTVEMQRRFSSSLLPLLALYPLRRSIAALKMARTYSTDIVKISIITSGCTHYIQKHIFHGRRRTGKK